MQATSDLRIKIVKDLYWGFHFYENFDSKPPISANKNDLAVSTSLGGSSDNLSTQLRSLAQFPINPARER